ncbi:uncharacterized protein [Pseudorasbora parva]|uniref:uncharacterized protein n=1 Tax=Pseudorasbora parva TaxID=51549 RepID=UPI00351F1A3F
MSPECDKDRRIISCLQCFKPQEMLPNHLLRVCMKNQTDEERKAEVERAKKSMKAWTLRGRTWDYNAMVKLYPDEASRQALLEDLRERNFLILNDPKAAQDAQAESRHRPPGAAKPIQPTLQDCQRVLRVSQADMLGIHRKLLDQQHLEEDQRTLFRYFCEAILVLRYFQRPEAVKAFKASDWINKTNVDGRIHMEVQSTKQSATFSQTGRLRKRRGLLQVCQTGKEHLLSQCSRRPPTVSKVSLLIQKEGWTGNCPRPQDVVAKWRPVTRVQVESDPRIITMVQNQKWTGLALKDFGAKGHVVVATKAFAMGSIVCDYHGKVITGAEGRKLVKFIKGDIDYLFLFHYAGQDLCVDSETFPCECHPTENTMGRKINHSSKRANLRHDELS